MSGHLPSRTYHSDTLDDRPEWWPARPAGVTVTERATGLEQPVTVESLRDDDMMGGVAASVLFTTDKVRFHGYFPAYKQIAREIGPAGRVCELGVWLGDSLPLWQAFYPDGLVVGVDHDERAVWPEGTVRILSDQAGDELPGRLLEVSPEGYDLIVDDASHDGALTRLSWELLWPLVRPGGYYVIEDWVVGLGVPPWNSDDDSMVRCAESFLPLLGPRFCDPDFITYRHGLIIMHRRQLRA